MRFWACRQRSKEPGKSETAQRGLPLSRDSARCRSADARQNEAQFVAPERSLPATRCRLHRLSDLRQMTQCVPRCPYQRPLHAPEQPSALPDGKWGEGAVRGVHLCPSPGLQSTPTRTDRRCRHALVGSARADRRLSDRSLNSLNVVINPLKCRSACSTSIT